MLILVVKMVLVGIVGYLLGSANSSLIIGKFYGVDVRQHGSGNAGATNTLRTLGKTAALLVGLGDVLKGVIACLIGLYVVGESGAVVGGFGAILGHNWPVYFAFKGGKGIFTSAAVIFTLDWKIGLGLLVIFLIVVAITRYVSLGSILSSAVFPIAVLIWARDKGIIFIVGTVIIAGLAIFRHRSNIQRLIKGTESKLGQKKTT